MRSAIALSQFDGSAADVLVRSVGGSIDLANSSGRLISYDFSDASVARDNHVIFANAWQIANFLRNPVFLWAHDSDSPPIGRVVEIGTVNGKLRGTVEYAERDVYPFAETIFQLTKAGFINATSTSWLPIEWKFSTDRSRPGGIDFSKVDLLEISQVPVPALPTALVTARAQGIDTGPIVEWCERLLDSAAFAVLPRAELELLRREAKMPAAKRTATPEHVSPIVEPPPAVEVEAAPLDPQAIVEPDKRTLIDAGKRGLCHVGWLAYLLSDLGYLQEDVAYEAAREEDGSAVPAEMLAALKTLGAVLVAMTTEEVAELLAGSDKEGDGQVMIMASGPGLKREAFRLIGQLDDGAAAALISAASLHLSGRTVTFKLQDATETSFKRAGKVLSAKNERCLRDALELHDQACIMVRSVVEQSGNSDDGDDATATEAEERAVRERKAKALKLRHQRT